MNCLVDTHIAIWAIDDSPHLPESARSMLQSSGSRWYLSIVSIWEVALKHQAHPDRLQIEASTFARDCREAGFRLLTLEPDHVFQSALLPTDGVHKDPFDRMLLAQARAENLTFMTHDRAFASYEDPHVLIV